MDRESQPDLSSTTEDLLLDLKRVMNESALVRKIVRQKDRLWLLQQTAASPEREQKLLEEIDQLRDQLEIARRR